MINAHFIITPTEDGDLVAVHEILPADARWPVETISPDPVEVHHVDDGRAFVAAELDAMEYASVPLEQRWAV